MTSEEKAESLYGPAPEGDEDPHASQEVPDPGESRSYNVLHHTSFTVEALNGWHLGRKVAVRDGLNVVVGVLSKVTHGASIIEEKPLGGRTTEVLGRRWVQVDFLGSMGARVSDRATFELLE